MSKIKKLTKKKVGKENVFVTEEILNEKEAVDNKVTQLETRIFGKATTKFDILSVNKVFVPYRYYVYDYEINRKTIINRSGKLDKKGSVAIVFDKNEVHPFEFDLGDEDKLDLKKKAKEKLDGEMLKSQCSDKETDEITINRIQNKILKRVYAASGDLKIAERIDFYRPAWQLKIKYKNSDVTNFRYAYSDNYGVQNEHILGLKFRLDGR